MRQYLNVASLPNEIVEGDILEALNEIMKPENNFTRIMCQEIETTDSSNPMWEILLVNENGKIPISSSGSGLKTVLLVLIKLFFWRQGNIQVIILNYQYVIQYLFLKN